MRESVFDLDTVQIHITMEYVIEQNDTKNDIFDQTQTNFLWMIDISMYYKDRSSVYVIHFCVEEIFMTHVTNITLCNVSFIRNSVSMDSVD